MLDVSDPDVQSLMTERDEYAARVVMLKKELAERSTELADQREAQLHIGQLYDQLLYWRTKYLTAWAEVANGNAKRNNETEAELEDYKKHVDKTMAHFQAHVAATEAEVKEFRDKLAEKEAELAATKEALADREQHIANIYNTASWKILTPLRQVHATARNVLATRAPNPVGERNA